VAFNNAQPAGAQRIAKLHNPLNPFAPGFPLMALRNMVGMSGDSFANTKEVVLLCYRVVEKREKES